MEDKGIISRLERMEDRIMDYKLNVSLFKEYCDFVQQLYKENYEFDYSKYIYLLHCANVIEPTNQRDYLIYQYYKGNIDNLFYKLEKNKSK